MFSILCVEDSPEYQLLIASALSGSNLTFASTLKEARESVNNRSVDFDMILLDLELPDGHGIKFLSELKMLPQWNERPVFILSVDNDILSKVTAFTVGAGDYICKPFHALELKARVEAVLKRVQEKQRSADFVKIGNLILDVPKMTVLLKNSKIDLTPSEFKILLTLSKNPEVIFSRDQIIDKVWGNDVYISDRTVDTHISHLRSKIAAATVRIETVVGEGYRLREHSGS